MKRAFSRQTEMEINRLVQSIAKKMGYSTNNEDFYNRSDMKGVFSQFKKKPASPVEQFTFEMSEFIYDCMNKLMDKGASEEQALTVIKDNFSNERLTESLNEFFKEYGGMEMERGRQYSSGISKKEILGMLYIAFIIIGLGFGALIGSAMKIILTGIISGIAVGIGCGIIAHAVILLDSLQKK